MSSADSPSNAPTSVIQISLTTPLGVGATHTQLQPADGKPGSLPELASSHWPQVEGYQILSVIGSGGMGIVYKAQQINLNRVVALKMLRGIVHATPEYRDRFKHEAETVAKLQHPNIIQVFEIGAVDPLPGEKHPNPFISLEFVDGGNLIRRTNTPQSPQYAARILEKLARAVHAAHTHGVVHRDLKPANVLLTRDGEPKIADFGVAKQLGGERDTAGRFVTQAGTVMGTPEYMAPEQAAGAEPTPSMDIYALGVILYELLTARIPFQGPTPADTMFMVIYQEPVSPRRLQPQLPRDLETICMKCLEKNPANRYASATALADDLAAWLDNRPIRARPVGSVERIVRLARRNPAITALSLAVVLVAIVGAVGIVWNWREARRNANAFEKAASEARDAEQDAKKAATSERWERYRSHMVAAATALQSHDVIAARESLETAPEMYRDWEWRHFHAQLDGAQYLLNPPDVDAPNGLTSPDGRWLLSNGKNYRLWDVSERKLVRSFPPDFGGGVTLSPNGKIVANVTPDNVYHLLDLGTNKTISLRGSGAITLSSQFSPDSSQFATFSQDCFLRVWDVATGNPLQVIQFGGEPPFGGKITPDLAHVLVSYIGPPDKPSPREIGLWDVKTRQMTKLLGPEARIHGFNFNASGSRSVMVESFPENGFHVWDTATGKEVAKFLPKHANLVTNVGFNTDNTRVASSSRDQTARLWDGTNGQLIATLRGHRGRVNDVMFSPEDKRLLTTSQDGTLRLWNAADGAPVAVLQGHPKEVVLASYAANGSQIVSLGGDGSIRIWDARNAERDGVLRGHTTFVYGTAFHPDNERIASASWDGTIRVWNATTGRELWSRNAETAEKDKSVAVSVAFHPGGRLLASLARHENNHGQEGFVRLWDVETGNRLHEWVIPGDWHDSRLTFSPGGELLACGNRNGGTHLWDVKTKAEVAVLGSQVAPVRDVVFNHDGRLLASGGEDPNEGISVWDVGTKSRVTVLHGHTSTIYALKFSPNGKLLASGSLDGTVRLWDTTTWKEVGLLQHGVDVYTVAFTREGTRLLSGCVDHTIRVWDVKTHDRVAVLRGHESYVHSIAFSPDGTRLVSASGDSTLRVWDTLPPRERLKRP